MFLFTSSNSNEKNKSLRKKLCFVFHFVVCVLLSWVGPTNQHLCRCRVQKRKQNSQKNLLICSYCSMSDFLMKNALSKHEQKRSKWPFWSNPFQCDHLKTHPEFDKSIRSVTMLLIKYIDKMFCPCFVRKDRNALSDLYCSILII